MEKEGRWGLEGLGPRRRAAGYTQASFAARLGIERGRYAMWESCAVWPSAQWLPIMAGLLGCGVADLYDPPDSIVSPEGGEDHAGRMPESLL